MDAALALRANFARYWPGIGVSALVAVAATFLARHYGAPVMLFALLLGMAFNFLSEDVRCAPGLDFVARHVLRLGVALLGLRITVAQVLALGWRPVVLVVMAVALTIGCGIVLARLLGFRRFFGLLTGGAVAICGASAALALSAALPQHPLKERATVFTVIGVSTLSTLAMVLYPLVTQGLGFTPAEAGLFLGGTIHDVAQVVGAGYSLSQETGDTATLVKLLRVAMLVPVIALAAWVSRVAIARDSGQTSGAVKAPLLPWFAIGFIALVAIHSSGALPPAVVQGGMQLSLACLVSSMAAIGVRTHLREIVAVGWRPVALMAGETLFLALLFVIAIRFGWT